MNCTYTDELYHHGIKGQKWGIRRYQNEDGTYTASGKERRRSFYERYRSGRDISNEKRRIWSKRHEELLTNSKEYQQLKKSNERLRRKYELDGDDGGGGNYERYPKGEVDAAGRKYYEQSIRMDEIDEEFVNEASSYAKDRILKKYGDEGLKDIETYNNTNAIIFAGTMLTAYGLIKLAKH